MLRKVLMVFQFAIALLLIIGTVTIYKQLRYMQNESLGMNLDQTLVVKKPFTNQSERAGNQAAFINGVKQLSGIDMVSASSEIPGQEISYMRWIALGTLRDSKALSAKLISVDEYFTDLFEIDVLYGRSFKPEFVDTAAVVLNLSAAKELFGQDADFGSWINQTIYYELAPVKLVGIINGVDEIADLKNLNVLPVPATDFLQVALEFDNTKDVRIQLFNNLGQEVVNEVHNNVLNGVFDIEVANLQSGMYQLRILADGEIATRSVVVQK